MWPRCHIHGKDLKLIKYTSNINLVKGVQWSKEMVPVEAFKMWQSNQKGASGAEDYSVKKWYLPLSWRTDSVLSSLTALSPCEIALGQISAAASSKVDGRRKKGRKKCMSLRASASTQYQTQESYEGFKLTSFSPTRVTLKRLQVGRRYPSSTSWSPTALCENSVPRFFLRLLHSNWSEQKRQDLLCFNPSPFSSLRRL